MEIQICSSCVRSSEGVHGYGTMNSFLEAVTEELAKRRPEIPWKVQAVSCQRFCPPDKITLVLGARLGMSRDATLEAVVSQILRIHG